MDYRTLMAARQYVRDTANGLGAVKGSPCTITSITEADDGIHIVFSWTGTDGTVANQTAIMPYVAVDKVAREAVETLRNDMGAAIDTTVRSINGRKPDGSGNVALPLGVTGVPNTGSPNQVFVTDGEGVPRWDDRKHWLELAAICPEILTDPDVKILYDPERTEIGEREFQNITDTDVVYFPNVETIGSYAFAGSSVRLAIIPKATFAGDALFRQSSAIESVYMPKVQIGGNSSYQQCYALKSIYCPEVTTLKMSCFRQCTALKEVYLPKVTALNRGSEFSNCSALEKVSLPELVELNSSSFNDCPNLTVLDLPKVTVLNRRFIDSRTGLKTLILRSETMCTLDSAFLASTPIGAGTCFIYVPAALIDTYKADSVWSNHAAQFRAIEDYPETCRTDGDEPAKKSDLNGLVKSVNGVAPDENGEVASYHSVSFNFIDGSAVVPGLVNYYGTATMAELCGYYAASGIYNVECRRIIMTSGNKARSRSCIGEEIVTDADGNITGRKLFFGDDLCPVILDIASNRIIFDPDWVAPDASNILTDSAGAKWKLVVGTDGTLSTEAVS